MYGCHFPSLILFILSFFGLILQTSLVYILVNILNFIQYGVSISLIITNFIILFLSIIYTISKYDLLDIKYITRNLLLSAIVAVITVLIYSRLDSNVLYLTKFSLFIILIKFLFIFCLYFFLLYKLKHSDIRSFFLFFKNKFFI